MSDRQDSVVTGIVAPRGFKIHEVESGAAFRTAASVLELPLGRLNNFVGNWKGLGFNTIFRPNQPSTGSDNVLELNVTTESLDFSTSLGRFPTEARCSPTSSSTAYRTFRW